MVLEACAAVGVAAAGIQFVDFAVKVASKSKEYQSNVDHYPQKHIELEGIAHNFARLTHALTESMKQVADKRLSAEETVLLNVAQDCHSAARDFQQALDSLKVQGAPRGWESFRMALESCWNEKKLERLLLKLRLAREDLVVHLLAFTSTDTKSGVNELLERSRDSEARVRAAIVESQVQTVDQIRDLVEQASGSNCDTRSSLIHLLPDMHGNANAEISRGQSKVNIMTDAYEIERMILHSLDSSRLNERYRMIPEAHAATFRWIFEDRLPRSESWPSLPQWLSSNSLVFDAEKIYSITGKAGSGKSTLMKFIYDNPRTKALLVDWAQSQDLLMAHCFFWNPGPEIQRSRGGLLRSLLYQLLSQKPIYTKNVAPWRWQCHESGIRNLETWTDFELRDAFINFLNSCQSTSKICLFIDGLDEYGESDIARSELVSLLKDTSKLSHVKICLSSRPLIFYEDALRCTASLELHRLTRDCIEGYVQANFLASEFLSDLKRTDPTGCSQLASQIVSQASGVFLWVSLVIRDLLCCLQNGDSISDLQRRLLSMPSDLYQYLSKIIGSLETFYLRQAYTFFCATIASNGRLEPLTYFYLQEGLSDKIIRQDQHERISEQEINARRRLAVRQLKSRCGGLLEVQKATLPIEKVTFLHRTVKELLENKVLHEMREQISKDKHPHMDPSPPESICKALLAQMKETTCCGEEIILLDHLQYKFIRYVRLYEDATESSLTFLVDRLGEHIRKVLKIMSNHTSDTLLANKQQTLEVRSRKFYDEMSDCHGFLSFKDIMEATDPEASFLYMTLRFGLTRYLTAKFSGAPELLQRVIAQKTLGDFLAEAIDTAFYPPRNLGLLGLLKLILGVGVDPNGPTCKDLPFTVWAHYLVSLGRQASPSWSCRRTDEEIVRVFIEHGAHQIITVRRRDLLGDLHQRSTELVQTSVFPFFQKHFDRDVALTLEKLMLERDKPTSDQRLELKSLTKKKKQQRRSQKKAKRLKIA